MAEIVILGSAFAVPTEKAENTHFLVRAGNKQFLVDCAGNPWRHFPGAGVDIHAIDHIILTHFHPDHVSGLPLLLMGLWLQDRQKPMHLYGCPHALERVKQMMALYDYESWSNFYPLEFHTVGENNPVLYQDDQIRIVGSMVKHIIPALGLRFELITSKRVFAYSGDTEPCDAVISLARDGDFLIHEASGCYPGHSSAAQAGKVAEEAGVKELYLIHYPTEEESHSSLLAEARKNFPGKVHLAEDYMRITL